jgi:hypothetical protein
MTINYTTQEKKMCQSIARIGSPPDYRDLYTHLASVAKPYGNYTTEVWINKMVAETIRVYEQNHAQYIEQDIVELRVDTQLRHI